MHTIKEISEFILGISLFLNACLFVPQTWRLYKTKDAEGISLLTFGGFIFIDIAAMVNGILFVNWAMIVGYALSTITCTSVVIAAMYYRAKHRQSTFST